MAAFSNEADIYLILGSHSLIAKCLFIDSQNDYIKLEYYLNGNLKEYIHIIRDSIIEVNLKHWASQLIESVKYIHPKGIRHSDLELVQWLVDAGLNARLSDFNTLEFDYQPDLKLKGKMAVEFKVSSYYLPRDPEVDNSIQSNLFVLASTLFELVAGQRPYEGLSNKSIEVLFRDKKFSEYKSLLLEDIIMGC